MTSLPLSIGWFWLRVRILLRGFILSPLLYLAAQGIANLIFRPNLLGLSHTIRFTLLLLGLVVITRILFLWSRRIVDMMMERLKEINLYLDASPVFFKIGLLAGLALLYHSGSTNPADAYLIAPIFLVLFSFDLAAAELNERKRLFQVLRMPGGPREPLMSDTERNITLPIINRLDRLFHTFGLVPGYLLMLGARIRRMALAGEGRAVHCLVPGCRRFFENPQLTCNNCGANRVLSWPTPGAPLFCECDICGTKYPTWFRATELLEANLVRFQFNACNFRQTTRCHNLGLQLDTITEHRVLLVTPSSSTATMVTEKIADWCSAPPDNQHPDRLLIERGSKRLFVSTSNPLEGRVWAGGYDWVVLVPHQEVEWERQQTDLEFMLARLQLPMADSRPIRQSELPSIGNRLFGTPKALPDTSLTQRPIIGLWCDQPLERTRRYPLHRLEVSTTPEDGRFMTFIREVIGK